MRVRDNDGRSPACRPAWGFVLGLTIAALVALAPLASRAVDFRWSNDFGQGWLIATVENENNARLTVSCNSGAGPQYAAYSVAVAVPSGTASAGSQPYAVQFVIDGRNQPFPMAATTPPGQMEFVTEARDNPGLRAIQALVATLRSGRSLVVEVPQLQLSQRFSLLDAATALEEFDHCGE